MAADSPQVQSTPGPRRQQASLHQAAWLDMLTNLHVAYAELTRAQLEVERRMAETNETRELFERVIESMSEALFLMDVAGRISRVNRAAGALLECELGALLGKSFTDVCPTADIPATPWRLLARAPNGTLPDVDSEILSQIGRVIPVSISCSLVRDQRGKMTGMLVIARNISERRRAEAERQDLQMQLVQASRRAGMADVAASMLHNVGNVLNSLNVSADLVSNTIRRSLIGDVGRIATMLQAHAQAVGDYLTSDPKGQQIPSYLAGLADHLAQEQASILEELDSLNSKIEHIGQIIGMQQDLTRVGKVREPVRPAELMEEARAINSAALERHRIEVVREYARIPQIVADKHLVLQILVNLISNAKYAMLAWEGRPHRLTLRVGLAEDRQGFVRLQVQDTGVGIKPEHLSHIFAQGFTTRRDGHGLGLHSGALAAKVMGGVLNAHSDGAGLGATFTLDLPLKPAEDRP
jgi:two-component system, LuxR family, sensor kinase FixL